MEKRNILILNGGLPYQVRPYWDEMENVFTGKSYIIESYPDFPLRRAGGQVVMMCPAVVMLTTYRSYIPHVVYNRMNLFQRDEYTCQYCGKYIEDSEEREVEHVIPRSADNFPGTQFENVVLACSHCNRKKSNKTLEQMKHEVCWNGKPFQLIKKPHVPRDRVGYAQFTSMVNEKNLMWLNYIPDWENYAVTNHKEWLLDAYTEYLERVNNGS